MNSIRKSGIIIAFIGLTFSIILATSLYFNYQSQKKSIDKNAHHYIESISDFTISKLEGILTNIAQTPNDLSVMLETSSLSEEELLTSLEKLLLKNNSIFGLCVAYEHFAFAPNIEFCEPYFYRENDTIIYEGYEDLTEDYFPLDWYKTPKDLKQPVWIEPYEEETLSGVKVMTTYSMPFYKKNGELKGIIAADVFLDDFQKYLAELPILKTGYIFTFSAANNILTHPNAEYVMHETMYSLADKLNQPVLKQIADTIKTSPNGRLETNNIFTNERCIVKYSQLSSGWGIAIVLPYNELNADLIRVKEKNIKAGIIGIVAIIGGCILMFFVFLTKISANYKKELEKLVNERTMELQEKNHELIVIEEELRQNNEELQTLNENIREQRDHLEEAAHKLQTQAFLGELLQNTTQPTIYINEFLQQSLDLLLTLPWLKTLSKGSVYLTQSDGNLKLIAQKGIDSKQHNLSLLHPGKCLCGKTITGERPLFCKGVEPYHELPIEDQEKYGHFNIPLLIHDHEIGVLCLYVDYEYRQNQFELDFLKTVANVLAAVIQRDNLQTELENQTAEMIIKNQELESYNVQLKKYHTALEQSPVSIFITDPDGKIEYVNPFFSKLTGFSPNEVIGHKPSLLKTELTTTETYSDLWTTITSGKIWKGEFTNRKKDNSLFTESAIITPILNDDNKITNYVALKEDITEINLTRKKIEEQHKAIERAHKNITDSIRYAKTIQNALLTSKELMNSYFKDYFLFYKPKEVVSGDFYYVNKLGDNLILTVADCTGHGVPGGFITILGITYIHEIVRRESLTSASKVLTLLRQRFLATFRTFGSQNNNGLDIAFCIINTKTNVLQYSGAFNPLIIIRNGEILEFTATKCPVGSFLIEKEFENHEVELRNNDLIYLFSDGFQDQFNGENNKKFSKKKFKEMLLSIQGLPLKKQEEIISVQLKLWQKKNIQLDDITVLGVKWSID